MSDDRRDDREVPPFAKRARAEQETAEPVASSGSGAWGADPSIIESLYKELPGGKERSVFDRWPALEAGLPTLTYINNVYRRHTQLLVQFYNEDGHKNLIVHELNKRKQAAVVNQYVRSICANGLTQDVRGRACALPSRGGGPPYKLITFGSLSRAAYIAFETPKYAKIPKVVISKEAGLMMDVYDERMPSDVVRYVRDYFNNFHKGSGVSFLETLTTSLAHHAEWKAYATQYQIPLSRAGKEATRDQEELWRTTIII